MIPFAKIDLPGVVIDHCASALKSGRVTNGEWVRKLEKKVCKVSGARHAIAVNSCTTGLLMVCGIVFEKCERIGLPTYTWPSTKYAVELLGKTPVWLDVHKTKWVVTETQRKAADGYLLVDTFGNTSGVTTKKPVVIDAAHSLGKPYSVYNGCNAAVYSLAAAKSLTGGEGGVIVTNEDTLARKLKKMRDWAGRMQETNAIIGLYSLSLLDHIRKFKEECIEYYKTHLPFKFQKREHHTLNLVGCLCDSTFQRDEIVNELKDYVELKVRYDPCNGYLPVSTELFEKNICLPSWYGVDYKEVTRRILEVLPVES